MKAVELFAGLGGGAEGAKRAGVEVVWAANHSQPAVDAYRANHPGVNVECQDLRQADFTALPRHDLQLASPCCQGHAWARGIERPHHDASRSTAWAVVDCAEAGRPGAIVVENVVEFLDWVLFPAWRAALEALGFCLSLNVLDAADHGVPQHRERLIVIGTRSRAPFRLSPVRREHVPFAAIIDHEAGLWGPVRTKCMNTRRRAARGRKAFGDRFVMPYYSRGSGLTGRDLNRPLGTVTTRDRWALVDGPRMRMLNVLECKRAMGFDDGYWLPKNKKLAKHLLGNAVPPVMIEDVITDLRQRL